MKVKLVKRGDMIDVRQDSLYNHELVGTIERIDFGPEGVFYRTLSEDGEDIMDFDNLDEAVAYVEECFLWQAKRRRQMWENPRGRWVITKDALAEEFDEVPGADIPQDLWDPEAKGGTPFMLYDDDNNLYYRGRYFGSFDTDEVFNPLRWAQMSAGCTYIKYRNAQTGKYETL